MPIFQTGLKKIFYPQLLILFEVQNMDEVEAEQVKDHNKLNTAFPSNKNQNSEVGLFLSDYPSTQQEEYEDFEMASASQRPIIVEIQQQQQDHTCIQHLAEVEKLTEGQKFIRHLLKEMCKEKKRVLKASGSDQNGLLYLDEPFNYNMLHQNDE